MDLGSLHDSLTSAGLSLVGAAYCTPDDKAAFTPAQGPVAWVAAGDAWARLDLSRDLTPEEQAQAEGIVSAWAEVL